MDNMARCVARQDDGRTFVTRHIAGETIIVPVSGDVANLEAVYTLNEVGSFVWQLIDGRRTAADIARAVSAAYDVSIQQASQDVDELLTSLEEKHLVRSAAAAEGRA